ncbi:hypothetical protein SHKM778_18260 [Streptomyces sp. KM77-8]|uniref:Bacterial Ig domain-containing protein n=1 Tax=Streptomyces haneummycinicus TaxID=3074435 RepID=A0AAT9HDE2_9ACTN
MTPGDGQKDVRPGSGLRVRVPDGRLESVRVLVSQDAHESRVPGRISGDGLTWRPDEERLALAAKYTVDAVAVDGSGRRSARRTTFTTYVPRERFIGYVAPEDRATVGTGMIVSLEFNRRIAHRAAVERAVRVTARPAVEIRPHWFGGTRLDFRPQRYWKPGTEVTVALDLRDVEGRPACTGSSGARSPSPSAAVSCRWSTPPSTPCGCAGTGSCWPPCRSPRVRGRHRRTTAGW